MPSSVGYADGDVSSPMDGVRLSHFSETDDNGHSSKDGSWSIIKRELWLSILYSKTGLKKSTRTQSADVACGEAQVYLETELVFSTALRH